MLEEAVEVCNPHRGRRGGIAALVADGIFRMAMDSVSSDASRVTIIGGGVVGCFLAYCLTLVGLPVTVIERERVGAGASGASAGNVQAVTGFCGPLEAAIGAESLRRWRTYLPAIKEESGFDLWDQEVRYLYAALDEDDASHLQALTATLQAQGLKTAWIDATAALALEPRLNPKLLGGMLHQDVVQMDAQSCVNALETIVRARGGTFIYREVAGLQRRGSRVTGVSLSDGSTLGCERLVLAMGGLTGVAMSRWLGLSLPIEPYSLQKLHVRPVGTPLGCAVRWREINIVTRRDGNVHVGSRHEESSREETRLIAQSSETGKEWLMERFQTILPGVEVEIVEAAAGLAAFVPDPERTPIVGRIPGLDNGYVAAPSTNGFLLSGLMGSVLAEYLATGREDPLMTPMRPDRPMPVA